MLYTQFASRLVASLAVCALAGNSLAAIAQTPVFQRPDCQTPPTARERIISQDRLLLASHENGSSSLGAVQILGTQPGGGPDEALSDSLWGNLILQMAYARDQELTRSAKKLKITDNCTLASIYGISGVSLAQSITSIATINQGGHALELPQGQVEHGHGAEGESGEGHHHTHSNGSMHNKSHQESYAPGILGIIASGSTLLALGLRFYFGRRYSKQIKQRQRAIKARVEAILARLERGESPEHLRGELAVLIGERATKEFSQLWRWSHRVAAVGASS